MNGSCLFGVVEAIGEVGGLRILMIQPVELQGAIGQLTFQGVFVQST
jgi:hypothetical protein